MISELKVYRKEEMEIKGVAGNAITGMKDGECEISILGISYPLYEEKFSHHVIQYENILNKFKKKHTVGYK